ncbi:type II toxin-antitoxin system RelB/DinJ family antitoxin [Allofranklinella schreckenbergeri]|uniref:Type II toxin-antitoxin system RelB/DinJ family antitoxin n=1 Tax=Allofranklinella schreckenbergeri TaxID=1076744 RepID=A0A3M6QDA4_9BURK|nr:type II toxin-antitoxin system RelB/DinJ family antitoxin [Allofranklinella schreckenbergeri]RMX01084.1 type II toxin-antitoxin system RelB/DinJ family antitoxin [Allofranklinella schreckenbergeri]
MANSVLISVRIDPAIKQQASEVLAGAGLSISDVMRMTLTKIASERRFSFEYQPNAQTAAVMQAVHDGQAPMQRAADIDALLEQLNAAD